MLSQNDEASARVLPGREDATTPDSPVVPVECNPLTQAVLEGNNEDIWNYCLEDKWLNIPSENYAMPLCAAIVHRKTCVADLLLRLGCTFFNTACVNLGSPLNWAVNTRNIKLLRLLLRYGCNISWHMCDEIFHCPWTKSIGERDFEIISILIQNQDFSGTNCQEFDWLYNHSQAFKLFYPLLLRLYCITYSPMDSDNILFNTMIPTGPMVELHYLAHDEKRYMTYIQFLLEVGADVQLFVTRSSREIAVKYMSHLYLEVNPDCIRNFRRPFYLKHQSEKEHSYGMSIRRHICVVCGDTPATEKDLLTPDCSQLCPMPLMPEARTISEKLAAALLQACVVPYGQDIIDCGYLRALKSGTQFTKWISHALAHPQPLKHQCRKAIRVYCGFNPRERLRTLPLPKILVSFLTMEEI